MGNFSLIYDGLVSLIETKLPEYVRLSDPYDLTNNDSLRLGQGYALGISDGENTERFITCDQLTTRRGFIIGLTRLYAANETDPAARAAIEKSIMEDIRSIWKELQTTDHLNNVQVASVKYLADTGIEYVFDDSTSNISVVSSISLEFFE